MSWLLLVVLLSFLTNDFFGTLVILDLSKALEEIVRSRNVFTVFALALDSADNARLKTFAIHLEAL